MKIQQLIIQKLFQFLNIKIEDTQMDYEFFLPTEILPKGFQYPDSYISFVSNELPDLEPWHFLYPREINSIYNGLKQRYPNRILVPFARRSDNDDMACFDASEVTENPKVFIIHDFASPGWEKRGELDNFLSWVEFAKEESKEWKEYWKN